MPGGVRSSSESNHSDCHRDTALTQLFQKDYIQGGENVKKEDLACLVFLASAALYVGAHVAWALVRLAMPAVLSLVAR